MTSIIKNLKNHGRETYAVYYGDEFVLKRPLPTFDEETKNKWLAKQHHTKSIIDEIREVKNPLYNIPSMKFINDEEYQILEERAPGVPLTSAVYNSLTKRQQFEIINSVASFLVDMNELKPVGPMQKYHIKHELKFNRLTNFIDNKMSFWFNAGEVKQMARIRDKIGTFEYETRTAWSHADINPGNVLYDPNTSKISFIDFAEAGYKYIYRDIFAPLQIELDIYKRVYEVYCKLHDKSLYPMPSLKNDTLREIMKYRIMVVWLRRFIKASDDLRMNPSGKKSADNNTEKIAFMRQQMQNFIDLEKQIAR